MSAHDDSVVRKFFNDSKLKERLCTCCVNVIQNELDKEKCVQPLGGEQQVNKVIKNEISSDTNHLRNLPRPCKENYPLRIVRTRGDVPVNGERTRKPKRIRDREAFEIAVAKAKQEQSEKMFNSFFIYRKHLDDPSPDLNLKGIAAQLWPELIKELFEKKKNRELQEASESVDTLQMEHDLNVETKNKENDLSVEAKTKENKIKVNSKTKRRKRKKGNKNRKTKESDLNINPKTIESDSNVKAKTKENHKDMDSKNDEQRATSPEEKQKIENLKRLLRELISANNKKATLYLGNVSPMINATYIVNFFGLFGEIEKITILPKGQCAFIKYTSILSSTVANNFLNHRTKLFKSKFTAVWNKPEIQELHELYEQMDDSNQRWAKQIQQISMQLSPQEISASSEEPSSWQPGLPLIKYLLSDLPLHLTHFILRPVFTFKEPMNMPSGLCRERERLMKEVTARPLIRSPSPETLEDVIRGACEPRPPTGRSL